MTGDSRDGRTVSGSEIFIAATRIEELRDDLSFADALKVARLVLTHQGNSMPTRGKRAVLDTVTAKRLARLGLVNLDEGWGAGAGTRGRSALMAAASDSATAMVAQVLQEERAEPSPASIQDDNLSLATYNAKADALWGIPNADGIYLTHVVVHGDDMSEEDHSKVGNRLLGAIHMAAREYGYDYHPAQARQFVDVDEYASTDPLVAILADGTCIAARSTSARGPGWHQDTRRPTPQEHARWAGLPIPPEPPPPPPSTADWVIQRIAEHGGQTFKTIRGVEFELNQVQHSTWIKGAGGRSRHLDRYFVVCALEVWPVARPSELPDACDPVRSQLWGLLADERVLGLRDINTGELDVSRAQLIDPYAPVPAWLAERTFTRGPER